MKYHIDTIPIWDAYEKESECPLCFLHEQCQDNYIDSFLGGSVMEPATRIEVNKKGFCKGHFKLLYDAQNRLGLALMSHTYLKETFEEMQKHMQKLQKHGPGRRSIFPIGKDRDSPIKEFAKWLDEKVDSCIICERLEYTLNRYAYTIIHLWDNDSKFKRAFKESKGFCMRHLSLVLSMAEEYLNSRKQVDFLNDLIPLQTENMERIEGELLWFTKKFDYQNQDKPWGTSRDALPRTIQKLAGIDVMEEK